MSRDPAHRLVGSRNNVPFSNRRAADHADRQSEQPGSFDLRVSCVAAGILGENARNIVRAEKRDIVVGSKRTTRRDDSRVRKLGRQLDRIHDANDIAMLRLRTKRQDGGTSKRREDIRRSIRKGSNGLLDVVVLAPTVAAGLFPGWSLHSQQPDACDTASGNGVCADLRRERMRRIENEIDVLALEVIGKTIRAAKAADSDRQWTGSGIARSPRERQRRRDIRNVRQSLREKRRFARAAEQQNLEWLLRRRIHDESPMP